MDFQNTTNQAFYPNCRVKEVNELDALSIYPKAGIRGKNRGTNVPTCVYKISIPSYLEVQHFKIYENALLFFLAKPWEVTNQYHKKTNESN